MVQITKEQGEVEVNLRVIAYSEHTHCMPMQVFQTMFLPTE